MKIRSCLLATLLIFVIPIAVGCTEKPQEPLTDKSFILSESYSILCSERGVAFTATSEAKDYVRRALLDVCDLTSTVAVDSSIPEGESYEILIGDTGRPESSSLKEGLKYNDYAYRVVSERMIVIVGGSPSATLEGAKKFCLDVLGYDGKYTGIREVKVEVGSEYVFRDEYPFKDMTVNGKELHKAAIAVRSPEDAEGAKALVDKLSRLSGLYIPIVKYDELIGDEELVICAGSLKRNGERTLEMINGDHVYKVAIDLTGGITVGYEAYTDSFITEAIAKIIDKMTVKSDGDVAEITFGELNATVTDIHEGMPVWTLDGESRETVSDGVLYREQLYYDEKGKPYRVYILEVDPEKNYFYMGTGGDTYEYYPSVMQSVKGHMQSAIANGYDVVAGVNADFFNMGQTNKPTGIAIKEGEMIALPEWTSRPYYGFTYSGESVIEQSPQAAYTQDLRTAVGGSHVIVKNSLPANIGPEDYDYGETANPRTLIGIRDDGTVLLVVIDGRQSRVSNGAPLAKCVEVMLELGSVSAINLDGGGSSTMITYDGKSYDTKNSPSDGVLRRVYNSVLVVRREE